MQVQVRKCAHVLERLGLAMAGAAGGLFVGAHVGSSIEVFTSLGFLIVMMIGGAIGFYLGIDIPSLTFHEDDAEGAHVPVDAPELLSAIGTFLAALAAFVSVGLIIIRETPHVAWTAAIMLGWVIGVLMQIFAGAVARSRARASAP